MMHYSPFSKPLDQVVGDDLAVLRKVNEGWFVDYKRDSIRPEQYGKSLSSFANHFGGWLFVGVEENGLRAESFPGIPTASVESALGQIRDGLAKHVSTPFYYQTKIINGPVDSIQLPTDKSILIIRVPEGENPPYIHSSGRIYRRIADSCDPKPEADRAVLDSMLHKSERVKRNLEEFLKGSTKGRSFGQTCVSTICLLNNTVGIRPDSNLSFDDFKKAIDPEPKRIFHLDNAFPTQDGYHARQLREYTPLLDLTAIRWWRNGNVKVTIPIPPVETQKYHNVLDEHIRNLETLRETRGQLKQLHVVDVGVWCAQLLLLLPLCQNLFRSIGQSPLVRCKVIISTASNVVPFMPLPTFSRQLSTHLLPSCEDDLVTVPPDDSSDKTFIDLNDFVHTKPFDLLTRIAVPTLESLGMSLSTNSADTLMREFRWALQVVAKLADLREAIKLL